MTNQVLTQKWRPKDFDQVVGQPHVVRTLTNALNQQHLHHAYLFTGSRGVGKTTIARIIAKCFNCEKGVSANPCGKCSSCEEIDAGRFPDFFEIDAASRTKVEDTRDLLNNVQYAPAKGRYKIYLIDEVHMLSGHSFNALLKTLEEPPEHVKFLLATTDPQKLPATVLSRCLQFHLTLMSKEQIAEHLQKILTAEKIQYDENATLLLGKAAQGSMRDALSLLDQNIAYGNGCISEADTKQMLGTIETTLLYELLQALANSDCDQLLKLTKTLDEQGTNFSQALADLLSILHQISICQALDSAFECDPEIKTLAQQIKPEDVQLYYQIGLIGQRDLLLAPSLASGFEMIILRMLAFIPEQPAATSKTTKKTKITPTPSAQAKPISPAAQPKATKNPETPEKSIKSTGSTDSEKWYELFNTLQLKGATRALAEQCSLKQLTDAEIRLSLHEKHKAFLQDKHIKRIKEAIQNICNKDMHVIIEIEQAQNTTETQPNPAEISKLQQQEQLMQAEQRILNDEKVQRIMQTFDATLIKDSIVPVDNT